MAVGNENSQDRLERMNQILFEKEQIIEKRINELKEYEQSLKDFEIQLVEKTNELKKEQQRIDEENRKLDLRMAEVRTCEEKANDMAEKLLDEKLKIAESSKEQLEKTLDESKGIGESFNLNELKASVGLLDAPVLSNVISNDSVIEEATVDANEEDIIPELFRRFEKEISKNYSDWSLIEMLPDVYCLNYKDLEIRIFDGELPEIHIVKSYRNAKTDRKLLTMVANISRVSPEWILVPEENQLVCKMPFTAKTKESLVLKKCSDFIKKNL